MDGSQKPLGLLERQMTIIEGVAYSPDGLYLNEIADWAGLPKATAHRILAGLVEADLLAFRSGGRKVYVVGPRLARLIHSRVETTDLRRRVEPILRDLVGSLHETAFLARLTGLEVFAVAMVAPETVGRGHVDPGRVLVPHAAASAKAIVAFQPAKLIDRILRPPLRRFTPHTITDPAAVRAEYEKVRKLGYAACEQEINLGIVAYALPVELPDLGVIYSVGVTGPLGAMKQNTRNFIIATLREAAERIALALARLSMPAHPIPWEREM